MSERPIRRLNGAPFNHAPKSVTDARLRAGLTKRALAAACGFSEQLMGDIEAGRRNATPDKLRKIAATLKCRVGDLGANPRNAPETAPEGRSA
ncbi:helix-turn-helix transcriptional regulator [[Kitasatospora] papulosa]|uniref:helix-turn-helix transcriptional regulator n=1 Tax=[Kitasatospora] papulosa TaxID=1464011 RepID=UPI00367E5418